MTNEVVQFLKKTAGEKGFQVFDSMFGKIHLGQGFPITQSSGAVYGIWVNDTVSPKPNLSEMPGNPGWYPVYWGKDVACWRRCAFDPGCRKSLPHQNVQQTEALCWIEPNVCGSVNAAARVNLTSAPTA